MTESRGIPFVGPRHPLATGADDGPQRVGVIARPVGRVQIEARGAASRCGPSQRAIAIV